MGNTWIVDVLADLRRFAEQNDLPLLAVQLDETTLVAQAEITQLKVDAPLVVQGECAKNRSIFSQAGASRRS